MYIHIPKEKRTKLEPSGKKGIFVGYIDSSISYKVYVLGLRIIEISRHVKFDEDKTSKDIEEPNDDSIPENNENSMIERESGTKDNGPTTPNPKDNSNSLNKKRSLWARKTFEEHNVALDEMLRETKKTRNYSCYITHINESTNLEPFDVEEALKFQAWKGAMIEEYQYVLKNNVWDIVPRPKDK